MFVFWRIILCEASFLCEGSFCVRDLFCVKDFSVWIIFCVKDLFMWRIFIHVWRILLGQGSFCVKDLSVWWIFFLWWIFFVKDLWVFFCVKDVFCVKDLSVWRTFLCEGSFCVKDLFEYNVRQLKVWQLCVCRFRNSWQSLECTGLFLNHLPMPLCTLHKLLWECVCVCAHTHTLVRVWEGGLEGYVFCCDNSYYRFSFLTFSLLYLKKNQICLFIIISLNAFAVVLTFFFFTLFIFKWA